MRVFFLVYFFSLFFSKKKCRNYLNCGQQSRPQSSIIINPDTPKVFYYIVVRFKDIYRWDDEISITPIRHSSHFFDDRDVKGMISTFGTNFELCTTIMLRCN